MQQVLERLTDIEAAGVVQQLDEPPPPSSVGGIKGAFSCGCTIS
jgi:hypothetical protein